MPGVWRKTLSSDNHSLGPALISNTEDSVSKVTLLLQDTVQPLWHSAYILPIGACGVEASSRQSAPEATKGLTQELQHYKGTAPLSNHQLSLQHKFTD